MAVALEQHASGSQVYRVTEASFQQSNIYCEVPYCTPDSRHFVYERTNPALEGDRCEFVVCEVGTWKTQAVERSVGLGGCAITRGGMFYFLRTVRGDEQALVRLDVNTGRSEVVHTFAGQKWTWSLGTVSPDGRYYARGKRVDDKYRLFGIVLVDLRRGTMDVIDYDRYIFNAHPQFEPGEGKHIMIQHNRGGQLDETGKIVRLSGEEGTTLYLLSVPDGTRTPLQVGIPYTTGITGHQSWIGDTQEMLLSVRATGDYDVEKGNLLGVRAGEAPRVASRGYRFSHVGTSWCGGFFSCDDGRTTEVIIGSVKTGRRAVVCESKTSFSQAQNTHAHPYLTPDLKWAIFNSDRSGEPHLHAATVPEGMVEALQKEG